MSKINILSADDYFYGIQIAKSLSEFISRFSSHEVNFYSSNCIKEKYQQEEIDRGEDAEEAKSVEYFIINLNKIDICFLDVVWFQEIQDLNYNSNQELPDDEGARMVIQMLENSHPNCLIILLTHQEGRTKQFQKVELDNKKYFFISKMVSEDSEQNAKFDKLSEQQIEFFLKILENWQLDRIKRLQNRLKRKLLKNLIENSLDAEYKLDGEIQSIKHFLFNPYEFKGYNYFGIDKIISMLTELDKFDNRPVKGIWKDDRAITTYLKIINDDYWKNFIDEKTNSWYNEIVKILDEPDYTSTEYDKWDAIRDPFGPRNIKMIEPIIANKIVWRRIIIRLDNDIKYKTYLKTDLISGIEKNGKKIDGGPADEKKLFAHLGFETEYKSILINNLFEEEKEFKKNLSSNLPSSS